MSTRKLVVISVLGAMALSLPLVARAQGSSSSPPARMSALETAVSALQTRVSTLEIALANETAARQAADAATLAAANAYADAAIVAEASMRHAGDIDTLAGANAYTDSAVADMTGSALLAHRFGPVTLSEASPTVVVRLHSVPAGTYAVFAKVIVTAQTARCTLPGLDGDEADVGNFLDDVKNWTVSLVRTATLTYPTDLDLEPIS